MGWIGRGGGGGGPRCIVLAASGQTFHRPSQLSSLFCLSFLFLSALTDLSVPSPPVALPFLPSPFLFSLLSPETPDNYCRLSRFRWPPRFHPILANLAARFSTILPIPRRCSRNQLRRRVIAIVRSRLSTSLTIFERWR